ncbi:MULTISPECIES: haloacid dehalogenase type II [Ramlibacter]|uniref:(S)-2-haloacid dehalogenase n=1 Tax=Ramlibacter aquaticus TaxID=2780094 RepID=A0ABR9SK10_9BURK|nr:MULTISPECIES: haloacid dehalogenase type II [Ramlibacter]MBE7942670.1 haloacid dehalogenase type II [Ramlibacter aquaticus]
MQQLTGIKALAFDAYGTVYDVHSVVQLAEQFFPGKGQALSQLWRAKQIEYMYLRTLMGRYVPHDQNTESALKYAMKYLQLPGGDAERKALMASYERLSPFPDAVQALPRLVGLKRSILSVGTPDLLQKLVANSGLADQFDKLFSVDAVKVYKPHPNTYQMAIDHFGVERHELGFVTSNYFDVAGARAFGFKVIWINRKGDLADELGLLPHVELSSIEQIPQVLGLHAAEPVSA